MKIIILHIFFVLVLIFKTNGQPNIVWTNVFGNGLTSHETGNNIIHTQSGHLVALGDYTHLGRTNRVAWLLKFNMNGDTLWTKTYGGMSTEMGNDILETDNGDYIIAANTYSFGMGSWDVWLIKVDSSGNTIWDKTYGGTDIDFCSAIYQCNDNGYIICGHTRSFGSGNFDIYVIKTDSLGDSLWTTTIGTPLGGESGVDVVETGDGFVLLGRKDFQIYASQFYLIKLDLNGNILWERNYGGFGHEVGFSLCKTSDGGLVLAGRTDSYGIGDNDIYLVKTDSLGDSLWTKTYGGIYSDGALSISETTDEGLILGGWKSKSVGDEDAWIIRTNAVGDTFWTVLIEDNGYQLANSITQISDTTYAVVGQTTPGGGSDRPDLFISLIESPRGDGIFLSPANINVQASDTILVPVEVEFPSGFTFSSSEIIISGFQDKLEFIEIFLDSTIMGNAGWMVVTNNTDSLLITASAGANEIGGIGTLFYLKLFVPDTIDTNFVPINIIDAIFDNGTTPTILSSGRVHIFRPNYGDVDLNGMVRAYDAAMILKYLVNTISLNYQQQINANVSLDSTVSGLDASIILQYVAVIIDTLPYGIGDSLFLASGNLNMLNYNINPGQLIDIPINLSNGDNIYSFNGRLTYNPLHLEIQNIEWSQMLDGFTKEVKDTLGNLSFAGAGSVPDGNQTVFVTITFLVDSSISQDSSVLYLEKLQWNEGLIQSNVAKSILTLVTGLSENENSIPDKYFFHSYPNPFNPSTTIEFAIPRPEFVTLKIYNLLGQEVVTLVSKKLKAGSYNYSWDAGNMASGVYIYKMKAGSFQKVLKMVYLK